MDSSNEITDPRDIPLVSIRKLRETEEKFLLTRVEDFNPGGSSEPPDYRWNLISEAVLFRDDYTCRVCHRSSFSSVRSQKAYSRIHLNIQVHHIIPRSSGGSNNFKNLITLCEDCHKKTFKGGYSGVPVTKELSVYSDKEVIHAAISEEYLGTSNPRKAEVLLEEVSATYEGGLTFSPSRKEGSNLRTTVFLLTYEDFTEAVKRAISAKKAKSYITIMGKKGRVNVPVKILIDIDGNLVPWFS